MPEFSDYQDGQLCWVDLASTDIEKAKAFYADLFGWTAATDPDPQYGGYTFFMLKGKKVAAVATSMQPNIPSVWNTSIKVSDIHKAVEQIKEAGGKIIVEPMQVGSEGSFAGLQDPSGAYVFLWQPENMKGAELASEANTWVWNIHTSRNRQVAKDFYTTVFGWQVNKSLGDTGDTPYEEFVMGETRIGGIMEYPAEVPADAPPVWSVIFAVQNCEETTAKAQSLGGSAWMENDTSMPGMTFSGLIDPAGGNFTVVQMS